MPTVLIVDDERDLLDLLALNLKRADFDVIEAADGLTAVKLAKKHQPDLLLLDLMLPGIDGMTVFKKLKKDTRTRPIPVIMLTAKGQLADKIAGLELGADDYLVKPFSPRELVLRVQNLLNRTRRNSAHADLRVGHFHLDLKNLKGYLEDEPLDLTTTEFKLLTLLIEHADVTQKRGDILGEVWGYSDEVHTRTLDTHVKRLREKLGDHAKCIETVRGEGYRFTQKPQTA